MYFTYISVFDHSLTFLVGNDRYFYLPLSNNYNLKLNDWPICSIHCRLLNHGISYRNMYLFNWITKRMLNNFTDPLQLGPQVLATFNKRSFPLKVFFIIMMTDITCIFKIDETKSVKNLQVCILLFKSEKAVSIKDCSVFIIVS